MFSTLQDVRLALSEVATSADVPQNVKDRLQGIISQLPTVDLSMQISQLNLKLDSFLGDFNSDAVVQGVTQSLGFTGEETLAERLLALENSVGDSSQQVIDHCDSLHASTDEKIAQVTNEVSEVIQQVKDYCDTLSATASEEIDDAKRAAETVGTLVTNLTSKVGNEHHELNVLINDVKRAIADQSSLIVSGDGDVGQAIASLLATFNASNAAVSQQLSNLSESLEDDTADVSTLVRTCTNTVKNASLETKEALAKVESTFAEKLEDGSQRIISASGVKFAEAYAIVEDRIIGLTTLLSASSARLLEEFASEGQNVGQYQALVTSIKPSLDSMREALDQAKDFMEASKTFVSFMSDVLLVSQLVDGLQSMWKQMDQSVRDQSKNFSAVLSSLTEERNKVLSLVKDLTSSVKTLNTIDTAVNVGRLVKETTTEIIDRTKPAPEAEVY